MKGDNFIGDYCPDCGHPHFVPACGGERTVSQSGQASSYYVSKWLPRIEAAVQDPIDPKLLPEQDTYKEINRVELGDFTYAVDELMDGSLYYWRCLKGFNPEGCSKELYEQAANTYERSQQKPQEGRKDDQDKVRIDLFPGEALFGISEILTSGAKRYSDRNWEKGMKWGRVFSALMRHMWAWWQGKGPTTKSFLFGELDPDTQCSHLWHAGACVAFLIAYEERKVGEDDRPV